MTFEGRVLSRLGKVFPDLDSAGEDSLSWSFAVGVVVSAFRFWLFLCLVMAMGFCSIGAALWMDVGASVVWAGGGTEVMIGT